MRIIPLILLLFAFSLPNPAFADQVSEVRGLFENYHQLESKFDPALIELYADDALIKNRRIYPNGSVRELVVPAPKYKEMLRTYMPLARTRGDYSTYSDITVQPEGEGVRVLATRYSMMKKYHSPISLLFTRSAAGKWQIKEELSESRP